MKKTAHLAGILYFIVVVTGIFSLAYVPSQLIDWKSASATTTAIQAHEFLFRLGILAGICCYVAFLLLPLALYKLLSGVNKAHATVMVALVVASVPIALLNYGNKFAVLTLLSKADYLQGLSVEKVQEQVLLLLDYHSNGEQIASVFWGLWLLPFGYLVFKSGFLPKVLGAFLIAGSIGYVINFVGYLLFSGYGELGISGYVSIPASIGEIGICLWLLVIGIRKKHLARANSLVAN